MRAAHVIGTERHQEAAAEVVAERDRADHVHARSAAALADRERGGHDRAAGMGLGDGLEVVGLVGVAEHAVGERRIDRSGPEVRRDDRGFLDAAQAAHIAQRHLARPHARARHHRAERVEDAVLALSEHVGRKRAGARLDHVAREASGDVGAGGASGRVCRLRGIERSSGKRCGGNQTTGTLQHATAHETAFLRVVHGVHPQGFPRLSAPEAETRETACQWPLDAPTAARNGRRFHEY